MGKHVTPHRTASLGLKHSTEDLVANSRRRLSLKARKQLQHLLFQMVAGRV